MPLLSDTGAGRSSLWWPVKDRPQPA